MKNILYVLIISVIFSCNISYPMQQSINTKQISLFACITAGCGISLYIVNQHKHSILHLFRSFYRTMLGYANNNSLNSNESLSPSITDPMLSSKAELPVCQQDTSQQNKTIIIPQLTPEALHQSTAQHLQKKEAQIKGTADLHIACENNDVQAVTLLLQNTTTNVNAKRDCITYHPCYSPAQKRGETPLHIACQNNNTEIVKMLLTCNDIDTTIQNKEGNTPLHIACENSNEEIVDLLLACENRKITLQNHKNNSPLHIACKIGNTKLNSTFLNKMLLIDKICDQQSSPFLFPNDLKQHIAKFLLLCYKDTIVQKLLNSDASNINKQNCDGESAIYLAYLHNHKSIFSLLFNRDNIDLKNLLSLACGRYDIDMITQLLKNKNIKLDNSKALYIACEKGYEDIVKLLLLYNTNNCMNINDQSHNPLLITCQKLEKSSPNRTKFVTIIKALLNDPAIDINIKTGNGLTVYHFVVSDCELLRLLLDKDDRFISEKETSGYQTPLHSAIKARNLESIFLLLEHGANISIKGCYGYTPFALACKKASKEDSKWFGKNTYKDIVIQLLQSPYVTREIINSSECLYNLDLKDTDNPILKLLLEYGADPNKISSQYGRSPMLEVAECNLSLLNLFIDQYNGDIYQKNDNNQTVLYTAFMSKNIKNPNEINLFKNLNESEKNIFMERELTIIANSTLKNIFMWQPYSCSKTDIEENNNKIQLFYTFITTCLHHIKKDLNITLLETAYANLQKRDKNFYLSQDDWPRKKKCMHLNKNICRYTHDTYNHKRYDGCDDCQVFFPYNELITHAFIQHIDPITTEQAVDKTIALTYKKEPATYYLKKTEEKENQKKYLKEQIEKLNSHQ